ncbi:uncharacterized protein LOC107422381 isoform X2 [Ziziphus jujuba]|uniref:Uncharacterized protein LOC107422381 isoform X2 n=1 Tax=Ziziphus jujuba TaxID=326968 RepID=A0A6P4A2P2_ZIZJJ|nr:uncharacterized protein LOC107422381 isoform X2 [Ziziphus jujuba]
MELPIPNKLKKLWDIWDLRVCILISLFLQVFLLLVAPFRQTTSRTFVIMSIWSAYLLADWVAAVSIGLITKSQTDHSLDPHTENLHIFAFWASFLLIHLGGPDSITSFSIEDNELWLRHLFSLILQVVAVAYSFFLTLPKNNLQLPTMLVFFVGIIKFSERIAALYLASLDRFGSTVLPEPNPGPDYRDAVATYAASMGLMDQASEITMTTTTTMTNVAHSLFETFKGLIVGFLLSSKDRESSRNTFLHLEASEAFRLMEYELSFMYQLLHTKVVMMRCVFGYILRIISFCFLIGALISFSFSLVDDPKFSKFSIYLTYSLLVVAIFLDIFSGLKLIFSKWTIIFLKDGWIEYIPQRVLKYLKRERWSGSMSQYNVIGYCLDERPKWLYSLFSYLHLKGFLETMKILRHSSSETVTEKLKSFIFNELKIKSQTASTLRDAIEACSQRGEWALLRAPSYIKLKWSIGEFQYAESLLLWHLATELCYSTIKEDDSNERTICKLLSDYMFYLLVAKPTMLAPVLGNWQVVFRDTCAEANRFFDEFSISDQKQVCEMLISVETNFRATTVKGNRSKSVLFDACVLAHQLQNMNWQERWKVMVLVWTELFCYAAINCRPIVHAQQPSRGGEFLTFTWLLMNHLGLGTQFYEQEQQAGKKFMPIM